MGKIVYDGEHDYYIYKSDTHDVTPIFNGIGEAIELQEALDKFIDEN